MGSDLAYQVGSLRTAGHFGPKVRYVTASHPGPKVRYVRLVTPAKGSLRAASHPGPRRRLGRK